MIAICTDIKYPGMVCSTELHLFMHSLHCVCTWLLTITSIIMHRHCLSQTTDMTHMHTSLLSNFSFGDLSIVKHEPIDGVRSRRPVEHVRKMRLFLDPSDHWLPFNRVQTGEGALSSWTVSNWDSVLSKVLSHELIFQYCESGGWSITPRAVQLHSLELNKGVVVPTEHHEPLKWYLVLTGPHGLSPGVFAFS